MTRFLRTDMPAATARRYQDATRRQQAGDRRSAP